MGEDRLSTACLCAARRQALAALEGGRIRRFKWVTGTW